jgi:hypothetical protein
VLSEKYNGRAYRRFIAEHPVWRELHGWIKSSALIDAVDSCLKRNQVDLGLRAYRLSAPVRWKLLRDVFVRGRLPRVHPQLYTRFEFSMLLSDGLRHPPTPIRRGSSSRLSSRWSRTASGIPRGAANGRQPPARPAAQLQPAQPQRRLRGRRGDPHVRVSAEPVRALREDLQLAALGADDVAAGPRRMRRTLTINIEADA